MTDHLSHVTHEPSEPSHLENDTTATPKPQAMTHMTHVLDITKEHAMTDMTDDPYIRPIHGRRKKSETSPTTQASSVTANATAIASIISDPEWATRMAAARYPEDVLYTAYAYFRASLATGHTPAKRTTARMQAAVMLVQITEDLDR